KWVVAMGTCLCTGGMFHSYSTVQGLDEIIPVDVYIPGCPPRPENVLGALQQIQSLIGSDEPPNKSRMEHDEQWRLGDLFYDKLAQVRAGRNGRVVKSSGRVLEVPRRLNENGELEPVATPMGIPVNHVRGGSVDLASNRYAHKWDEQS
ncbi:MAG: hypothetical protein HKN21_15900, partial [Candidatus Eisenbacteria bacterium]|nr:hypothetical protein [Candidatus Eisenbacteria bacterium]